MGGFFNVHHERLAWISERPASQWGSAMAPVRTNLHAISEEGKERTHSDEFYAPGQVCFSI